MIIVVSYIEELPPFGFTMTRPPLYTISRIATDENSQFQEWIYGGVKEGSWPPSEDLAIVVVKVAKQFAGKMNIQ